MRFEKGHKAATRQRIIEVASQRFRKEGVEAVGIAGLMADAGLTHGGFYAHFESKEELVREAMAAALAGTSARLEQVAQKHDAGLEGIVRHYLRPAHRDNPEQGCIIPALAAEVARHSEETRHTFTARIEAFLVIIAAQLPTEDKPTSRQCAMGILSVMIGALQLSRAVVDPKLSDELLEAGIQSALHLAGRASRHPQ